jgi:uncharacterized membrane protein
MMSPGEQQVAIGTDILLRPVAATTLLMGCVAFRLMVSLAENKPGQLLAAHQERGDIWLLR